MAKPLLSTDQKRALQALSGYHETVDPTQIGQFIPEDLRRRPQLWAGLARRGYLSTFRNSEQVRGERRVHWVEYGLTDAGRAILAADKRHAQGGQRGSP